MTRYRQRLLVSSALVIASLASNALGGTLPTGGTVVAGTGGISQTSPSTLTVTQSSATAIINWNSFSIGQGSTVQFNNGSGATLNRVTGASISQINGLLSATGSVYLVNPNGVIIGKTGVVNTGGTFVASTLDVTNNNFLGGGPLTFTGPSATSVVNLGKIGSLGGNVVLIAQSVTNAGTITAANGTIGLAAGSLVTLMDDTTDDGGLIKVQIGEVGDSLTNSGALAAAAIELRAQQGNIFALAGNTSGVIDATGVATKGGQIFLTNPGGATTVTGTLDAEGAGGTPGAIETSGGTLDIGSAIVNAHGGAWLLDPDSLTIDSTAAATINAALGADTSVVESTASKAKASSASAGTGDITVAAALSWSTDATLTLDSYNSIFINAPITVSGAGGVILVTNDTGGKQKQAGKGGDPNGGLYFGAGASLDFTSEASNPTLTINGNAYTLLYNLAQPGSTGPDGGTDDLAGIDNADDGGYYALANNLVAPTGVTFGSALAGAGGNVFSGVFEGLGHTITGLTINDSNNTNVGLFGTSSGVIRDIGLIGVSVGASRGGGGYYGSYGSSVGGLVGQQLARGSITGAYVTGTVFGGSYTAPYPILGGLVGDNYGAITRSGSGVSMTTGFVSGGLVGVNESTATISQSYATGAISGTNDTGGLAGRNFGAIDQSYATGAVTVYTRPGSGGGLVGYDGGGGAPGGQITNSYATGSVTGVGYIGGIFGYASSDGDPLIANSFATGAVHSSTGEAGGLAGHTEGTITASFWDTQTTGAANAVSDNSGTVSATGLTTAQFQDGASASGLGSAFALGSGLYPYLTSLFPNGVQAISGFAYSDVGANGLADQTVSLIAGGVATGSATTGANGYYYLTLQAGTVTPGEGLLAYAPSANSATLGLASGTVASTGALPGLSLYGQTVTVPTASTTLSGAPTMSQAQALAIAADDAAGDATPTIRAATGLGLVATGASFTVDTPVSAATNLVIATPADIPLIVSGAITATGGAGIGLLSGGALTLNAPIAVNGAGSAVLTFGTEGMTFAPGAALSFNNADGTAATAPVGGQSLAINGQAYTLLYTLANSGSTGPDGGAYDIAGIDNSGDGGYYALATDLTAPSGVTFTSALAGAGGNVFGGVFEGLGHTITDLSIYQGRITGLFGQSGGVIRDIGLVDVSVTGNNFIGALVGIQTGGTIINAYATGAVSGAIGAGGLVGMQQYGAITNAYAAVVVDGASKSGGLVGAQYGGSITNSHATGAVTGGSYLGGLVGVQRYGAITHSYATGAVNGGNYVGGLVGDQDNGGAITDAYATGAVTGNNLVGGLVGHQVYGTITNAYATGAVSGNLAVGGLVGNQYDGSITDAYATGAVSGVQYVGGLVGVAGFAITDAYATGAVSGGSDVGGLVGLAFGPIIDTYATGAVSGSSNVGGLVGSEYNDQYYGTIANSYWDTVTTGQGSSAGGTGLTTAQLQNGGASFANPVWGGGAGGLYPYLTNFFPNGVQAISGFAYSDVGATPLAGQTVSLIANNTATGSSSTGVNGYYYLALQPGTLTVGESVLAYAPSANSATLGSTTGSAIALTGPSLYGQTVTVPTTATTLSAAPSLAGAQALAVAADDAAGDATPTIQAATGLGLVASGASFTVDQAVTGGLYIQTTAANAPITVSSAINANNGSGVALLATGVLTIAAPVTLSAAGGAVILSAGDLMHIDAPISVQGPGNVVLTTPADYDFGLGVGGFSGGISYNVGGGEGVPGQTLSINGQAYTLLYSLSDLQSIDSLGDGGNYALAAPITQAAGSPAFAGPLIAATFSGVFEGLGNTISGLTINDASDTAVGLFAVNGGVIRDLGLVGGSVTLNASGANVGGLVGYQYGSIKNSYSSQTVTVAGSYSSGGGLVGANGGVIDNSYATGAVTATSAGDGVGGLVGFTAGSVTNAYATGAVWGGLNAGGLAGYNNGVVSNSYATGAVGGGDYARVGGLVGYNASAGTITNSFATGAIAGGEETGGLVGYNAGTVNTSYASGAVSSASSDANIGGLVGVSYGTIEMSYATGTVTGSSSDYDVGGLVGGNNGALETSDATGAVSGVGYVGGLVGGNVGTVETSYATGTVNGGVSGGNYTDAGGLVGANFSAGTVETSYATGSVSTGGEGASLGGLVGASFGIVETSYATGAVSGGSGNNYVHVGGLIGENSGTGLITASHATGLVTSSYGDVGGLVGINDNGAEISDSYATGAVRAPHGNLGGLVGTNNGTIGQSYATGEIYGELSASVGGLVGVNDGSGVITESYATGVAIALNGGTGGLVGQNYGIISTSYATGSVHSTSAVGGLVGNNYGSITASFATGSVNGGTAVGGLVGQNGGRAEITSSYATGAVTGVIGVGGLVGDNFGTITDTYATGIVSVNAAYAAGVVNGAYILGALAGYNLGGDITASFWNTDVSGSLAGIGSGGAQQATGVTTAQLETLSTFTNAGWNIDDQGGTGATWRIYDGATAPLLRSFLTPLDLTGSSASTVYDAATQTLTLSLPAGANASLVNAASGLHAGTYQSSSVQLGYDISGGVLTITPEAITVTASANSKVYNGTLIAAATPTVTSGTLYAGDGTLAETYASKDVGSTITLTPTATLATPGDYAVTYVSTGTGVITPATLTASLTGTVSKTYNDSTAATLTAGNYALAGVVAGDSVSLNDPTSGTYATLHAGTGETVTVTGLALTNNVAGDYVLGNAGAAASAAIGTITPEAITVTASANSKVYNGTTVATAAPTVSSGTLYAGDGSLAETYASKDVGSTIALTPTATLATPGDYSVTYVSTNTGVITPATLTASLTGTVSKTYNDSTAATLTAGNYALAGVVAGDSVSLNDPTSGTYGTVHAGTGETVTVTGLALTNNAAGDYVLGNAGAAASAAIGTITPEAITVTASANSKVYNGTTLATAAPTVTSGTLYAGDGTLAETYASKDVGSTITLTPTATLATPGDYSVTYVSTNTGVITPATLTATVVGNVTKVYDSNDVAPLTGANIALTGVVAGDSVGATSPSAGEYATDNVGTGILVGATGFSLTGASAKDYTVANAFAFGNVGTITPESITVTASANTKVYNGTLIAAATPTVTSGTLYAGDGTLAETYASKNVGSALTLTPSVTLVDAADYTVTLASANTGVITPATLTASLTGTVAKTYNDSPAATLAAANYSLSGIVAGDTVGLNDPTTGAYATVHAGTGETVTVTGLALTNNALGDYVLGNPAATVSGAVGVITPEAITVTAGANTKVYNGTLIAAATPTVTSGTLYAGDGSLAETYASKDVGSTITLTPTATLATPGDYAVTYVSANTGVITPATLTATVVGNVTKVYDSNDVAPLTGANIALTGVVAGDSVGATNPSAGEYATDNVGTGILVGATGFSLTGASAKDYTVANAFAFGNVGTITPEAITVTAVANTKVYNGTTAAAATPKVTSGTLYAGDGTLSETYANPNVGTAIALNPSVTLVDPADYAVTLASANTGVITPAPLSVSLIGTVSKVYNGTTVATLAASNYSVTGVIGSDQVSVANTTGTYATKNVAYAIPVTVSGLTLAGAQAQDYAVTVTSVTAAVGTITPDIIQTTPLTFAAGDLQYLQLSAQAPGDYGLSETIGSTTIQIFNPTVSKYSN